MAFVTADGFAKPFDVDGQFYPAFGNRIPALRGFYLAYDVGDPSPGDHQISHLRVLAGGPSEDLSPNADLNPSNIPDGTLDISLQDKNPGGEEFFYSASHSLLNIPGVRRYQVRDVGCVGECSRVIPQASPGSGPANLFPPIIALVGFKLFFTGARDHELDRIGVWFRGNELHVALRDRNGDDTFGYLVDFVVIPTRDVNISSGVSRDSARGGKKISIPSISNSDFLLTGWIFDFVNGEHEIRDLGVLRSGDNLQVFYGDKNADDLFRFRVEWAQVGRRVLSQT
ncbi:MAG: hypothetical protein JNN08_05880 [Bryobacterales bacterium]|nr:hypothetical protein [Bryobacterales bacterium]